MDQPWQIELLGWLRVVQADRVVSRFRTRKAEALLAYLAYHAHRSHPREQLIELLWPETELSAGLRRLRVELTSLRHQLEPPGVPTGAVLTATRTTVQLNPETCVTDVARFEAALDAARQAVSPAERAQQLGAAARLYRGELLPGLFDEWIFPDRRRLAEAFHTALRELVGLLEKLGDLSGAQQWALRAVGADPLEEENHHRLIRLLLATGQIEAARDQYEHGQRLLMQELGAGLSPEIRRLIMDAALGKDRPPMAPLGSRGKRRQREASPTLQLAASPAADTGIGAGDETGLDLNGSGTGIRPTDNLPLRFTRFFGREQEIAALVQLLSPNQHGAGEPRSGCEAASGGGRTPGETRRGRRDELPRLITLTGTGGNGKTRLALEVAQELRGFFPGGVWFVSLRELTDAALIPDQILLALRLPRNLQSPPVEQVVQFLSQAPVLLILDNYEHLVEPGVETAEQLLEQVEPLTMLVTSRQRLGLEGEREFPVEPLPLPGVQAFRRSGVQETPPPELNARTPERLNALLQCPSVALFVDRAQAVRPDFQVTAHNAAAVAALCQRLEGLPLAIVLAAARANVLTPQQMLSRLEQRFELLVGRQRVADPRHRSLRATLDWSYQLLTPELQRFFTCLSVFRGGWTLEAAEAVGEEPRALEYLEELQQCSLVVTETAGEAMRYSLLETLREYGAEQLTAEERIAVAHRHLAYYVAWMDGNRLQIGGRTLQRYLDETQREHDNLRAALDWMVQSGAALNWMRTTREPRWESLHAVLFLDGAGLHAGGPPAAVRDPVPAGGRSPDSGADLAALQGRGVGATTGRFRRRRCAGPGKPDVVPEIGTSTE